MGFPNIQEWADSIDDGRFNVSTFRKQVSSAATVANDFIDYTYFSGNPPANFYATTPLESSTIDQSRGIYIPNISGQFIKSVTLMSAAASTASITNQNQHHVLMDYLIYYPFIDTDVVGEEQTFTTPATLPRYTDGTGVQIIAVSQSASSTVGTFTVNYTNSDGVSGRTSAATFTKAVGGGGVLVSSTTNAVSGSQRFIELQAGDKGVRSIEGVTFSAAGGGLMALVLVRPLWNIFSAEECRSNAAAFGAATYFEAVLNKPTVEIKQGAVLGIVGLGNAGSLASSVLVGSLETVWR